MDSRLGTIKGFVDNFASVISDVLDTDVIITDSNMNIVGSAFKYFSLYQDIKIGSLIADVLINRHNLLIEDNPAVTSCRECEKYRGRIDFKEMHGPKGTKIAEVTNIPMATSQHCKFRPEPFRPHPQISSSRAECRKGFLEQCNPFLQSAWATHE